MGSVSPECPRRNNTFTAVTATARHPGLGTERQEESLVVRERLEGGCMGRNMDLYYFSFARLLGEASWFPLVLEDSVPWKQVKVPATVIERLPSGIYVRG